MLVLIGFLSTQWLNWITHLDFFLLLYSRSKISSSSNLRTSSTASELFAILSGLKDFYKHLFNEQVVWHFDNQAAVSILKKGSTRAAASTLKRGSTKSNLQILAKNIWHMSKSLGLTIEFVWMSPDFNVDADFASQLADLDAWCIREIFRELQQSWGYCTVDIFASPSSKECAHFVSRWCSSDAVATDAFSDEAHPSWVVLYVGFLFRI